MVSKVGLLSDKQRKEADNILKNYKYVYVCEICNVLYGSDLLDNSKTCPLHTKNKGENFKR